MKDGVVFRSEVKKAIEEELWLSDSTKAAFRNILSHVPAADAETVFQQLGLVKEAFDMAKADLVPVVRCRYCVNWKKATVKDGFLICPKSGMKIMARTYCSYGKRRADNADEA